MPGVRWKAREIDVLIELDARHLTDAEIAVYTRRTIGAVRQKLHYLRQEGRAYPSTIARRRDLTAEQRELMALYRRKKVPAADAWAAIERGET